MPIYSNNNNDENDHNNNNNKNNNNEVISNSLLLIALISCLVFLAVIVLSYSLSGKQNVLIWAAFLSAELLLLQDAA